SLEVFPASISKSRTPIRGLVSSSAPPPGDAVWYPLKKKRKGVKHQSELPVDEEEAAEDDIEAAQEKALFDNSIASLLAQRKIDRPFEYATATTLSYQTKENLVAGGRSIAINLLQAYQYIEFVNSVLRVNLRICNFRTQNIVCSCWLGFPLNLNWIWQQYQTNPDDLPVTAKYAESFSGLAVKYVDNSNDWKHLAANQRTWMFVVFDSGEVIATGLRHMEHIPYVEARMHRLFDGFRKGTEPAGLKLRQCMRSAKQLKKIKAENAEVLACKPKLRKQNPADRDYRKVNERMRSQIRKMYVSASSETDPPA
ncbi:MAG: hypothetical protein P4L87_14190, partial [Formivibrio sp.]|nr:hypothetical protein [Formivibrio sp.]